MEYFAVGSYTTSLPHVPRAAGRGLQLIALDAASAGSVLSACDADSTLQNPSFAAWDGTRGLLYSSSEAGDDPGQVNWHRISNNGQMDHMGSKKGPGFDFCHISLAPNSNALYASSYGAGKFASFGVGNNGNITEEMMISFEGSGADPERQEGPHIHQALHSPWSDCLYLCDLGTDRIWSFRVDSLGRPAGPPTAALELPPGYGPRHLAFNRHTPRAYILCELAPRIVAAEIHVKTGALKVIQDIPSTAGSENSASPAAATMSISPAPSAVKVHPSGRSLAVANRFTDHISVFYIGSGNPALSPGGEFSCGGKTPRDMEFNGEGSLLLIANQDSDCISSLGFSPGSGSCEGASGPELPTGSPACIVRLGKLSHEESRSGM